MNKNGLKTFGFHNQDDSGAAAAIAPTVEGNVIRVPDNTNLSELAPETVARLYVENALANDALPTFTIAEVSGEKSEFKSLGTEVLPLTNTQTVKFRQYYRKLPVYGSLITVELEKNNELLAINSSLGEPFNVDSVAKLSPAQILDKIRGLAGYSSQHLDATPRLYYYFDDVVQRWRLVYIVEEVLKQTVSEDQPQIAPLPELVDYVIDAHTGELVAELPRSQNVQIQENVVDGIGQTRRISYERDISGNKSLLDQTLNVHTHDFQFKDAWGKYTQLPGFYVIDPPSPWEPGGLSAHANTAQVARFLRDVLQRNGIDNRGKKYVCSINCLFERFGPNPGREWKNAAWFKDQMIYGQRMVGGQLRSYAIAGDVVAHEVFHGVTRYTADLQYRKMTGALNESYSDIFGILISNFDKPDIDNWNWEMGEDLAGTGIPLRDLSDPTRRGQPGHMNDYRDLPDTQLSDFGGVHINSGIHNKAVYNILTAKDNSGNYLFDARSVAILFYNALTQYLSRTSGFSDSRRAIELVARTLFRSDPTMNEKLRVISQAFDNVGIS